MISLLRESRISWISSKFAAKNIIREFLVYAKRPTYILEESVITQKEKIFYIKQLLKFEACVALILFPLIFLTKELTNAEYSGFKEDNWKTYFIVVLVAPILEEVIFRNALRYSRIAIAIGICLGSWWIAESSIIQSKYIPTAVGLSFLLVPIIYIGLKYCDSPLKNFWTNNFHVVFHVIAISFGLMHLLNYDNINNYLLAIPLVSVQIVFGYLFGFVRMKFGLSYSIGLHITWNFILSIYLLTTLIIDLFLIPIMIHFNY
ncbi:MAG: CPBP family glutamic-type intramembrane protease [Arcicella sp.]|nr:CPBP family glutamic-type intramembrane protease [Arcicella sp.]